MADEAVAAPKGPSKLPLIIAGVNTLAVLGAVGMLVYTKVMFKRPPITEAGERERLAAAHASPAPVPSPGYVVFEPFTVNIAASPGQPKPADGTDAQIAGKLHYATLGFSLEIWDDSRKTEIDGKRALIMDRVISLLGRKSFNELTTVQGRYLLRNQILDITNQMTAPAPEDHSPAGGGKKAGLATNVFFTQFVVQ